VSGAQFKGAMAVARLFSIEAQRKSMSQLQNSGCDCMHRQAWQSVNRRQPLLGVVTQLQNAVCTPSDETRRGANKRLCEMIHALGCHPASAHSSPLTAELEIMKQMASAISSGRIKRRNCV
jgi:hypothetical protein